MTNQLGPAAPTDAIRLTVAEEVCDRPTKTALNGRGPRASAAPTMMSSQHIGPAAATP